MMISAYQIGVNIALTNGISSVLAVIQKDVLGLNKAVNLTQGGFNRMKLAAIGLGAVTVGGAMLTGLYHLSKAAEGYTHQLEEMKIAGMSALEQREAIAAANRVASQVLVTNPTENLQSIRELRAALNSAGASPAAATAEAVEHLQAVQKASAVMTSALGSARKSDVFEMVKALEDIGATQDPARFDKLLDGMVRASIATGGRLTGRDFFQTLKYTRGAGQGYSDEFLTKYLPTLMQEMKAGSGSGAGGGPGNPLASLFQAVVAGKIGDRAAVQEWLRLGLVNPAMVRYTKSGLPQGVKPGGVTQSALGVENPYRWIQEVLNPALQRAGITDKARIVQEIAVLFGNRVAQQMVGLLRQAPKMEGDRKLYEAAQTMDAAYAEAIAHDPVLTRVAAHAQWERVQADIGKAITPSVTSGIFLMARGLSALAETIERHPTVAKFVVGFIAAMSGLLVVAGTIAIITAAIGALGGFGALAIGAGIAAFGTALYGLYRIFALVNWSDAMASLTSAWRGVGSWFGRIAGSVTGWLGELWASAKGIAADGARWVAEIVTSLKADLVDIWTGLTEGLASLVRNIGAFFASLPGKIMGSLSGPGPMEGMGPAVTPNMQLQAFHPATQPAARLQNISYVPPPPQRTQTITAEGNLILKDGTNLGRYSLKALKAALSGPDTGSSNTGLRGSYAGDMAMPA